MLIYLLCHLVLTLHLPVSFSADCPLIRHSSVSTSLLPNSPPPPPPHHPHGSLSFPPLSLSLAASFIHSLPPADAFVPHFFPPPPSLKSSALFCISLVRLKRLRCCDQFISLGCLLLSFFPSFFLFFLLLTIHKPSLSCNLVHLLHN